jgi:hypothetical protein
MPNFILVHISQLNNFQILVCFCMQACQSRNLDSALDLLTLAVRIWKAHGSRRAPTFVCGENWLRVISCELLIWRKIHEKQHGNNPHILTITNLSAFVCRWSEQSYQSGARSELSDFNTSIRAHVVPNCRLPLVQRWCVLTIACTSRDADLAMHQCG